MEHKEIRRLLSPYLDHAVSPEERVKIEAHLADCASCRAALADLERTVGHLKGMPEVEPPPWMSAKIMVQVRLAAGDRQPGFWRRLFLPRRLPLEALALVFLCVTGYYLASSNAPLLLNSPSPSSSREETSVPTPAPVPVPTPAPAPAPTQSRPAAPATQLPPSPAAAPKADSSMRAAASKPDAAPRLQEQTGSYAPPPPARAPAPLSTPLSAAPAPGYSAQTPDSSAAGERFKSSTETEWLSRRAGDAMSQKGLNKRARADEPNYSTRTFDASAPGAAPRESRPPQPEQAEQPERQEQVAQPERVEVALKMNDPAGAASAIEKTATRLGGKIVRRVYGTGSHLLVVRIPTGKSSQLIDRLARIGTLRKAPQLPAAEAEMVDLAISW